MSKHNKINQALGIGCVTPDPTPKDNCAPNPIKITGCLNKTDLLCAIYTGEELVEIKAIPGMDGNTIIKRIYDYVGDKFGQIGDLNVDIENIGEGEKLYKGLSTDKIHQIKSILKGDGINLEVTDNEIEISTDIEWLESVLGNDTLNDVTQRGNHSDNYITIGSPDVYLYSKRLNVGFGGLPFNSNGFGNTFLGGNSLEKLTTGQFNIALGFYTLGRLTSGSDNIVIGTRGGEFITTGSNNILIGREVSNGGSTLSNKLVLGNLLYGDMGSNFGTRMLKVEGTLSISPNYIPNASGDATYDKVFLGNQNGTFGWKNVSELVTPETDTLASVTLRGNYTDGRRISFGTSANATLVNTSMGMNIPKSTIMWGGGNPVSTANGNTVVGFNSLTKVTTGGYNSFFGPEIGANLTTGGFNSFYGAYSGYSLTTAIETTSMGLQSLEALTTGNYNTALGTYAGSAVVTGAKNVIIGFGTTTLNKKRKEFFANTILGYKAGQNFGGGSRNILIGRAVGGNIDGDNNMFIGNWAGGTHSTASTLNNKLIIHNNTTSTTETNDKNSEGVISDINSSNLSNALITGDFAERWVKFNGGFSINPNYIPNASGDATFTKQIVAKDDGTFGWENKPKIKVKPSLNINSIKKVKNNYIIKIVVSDINESYSVGVVPADYKLVFRYNTITGGETIINNASILDWHTYYTDTFIYTYCVVLAVPVSALSSEYNSDIVGTTMRNLYIEWSGISKSTMTNDKFYKAANAIFY